MKQYGSIDESQSWGHSFFIRFESEGEIAETSDNLDRVEEDFGVKIKATKEENEDSENELGGYIASDSKEVLLQVQSKLNELGWAYRARL